MNHKILTSERTDIFVQNKDLTDKICTYYRQNKNHLSPWEPLRPMNYYSKSEVEKRLHLIVKSFEEVQSVQLAALDKNHSEVIALCNFTNIVRGPFLACFLGYSLSKEYEGKGYMFEVLTVAIEYMFHEIGLHRIMANYIPSNNRSGKLLEKLGFEREGLAKSYLKINGHWEDHVLTSLISKD